MAIVTTPLGFQKPDGNEALRNGDNVIAANGAKAEELHQDARGRLTVIEAKNAAQDTDIASARTDATAYTDTQVNLDRGRLTSIESTNTTQDGRIVAVETGKVGNADKRLLQSVDGGTYVVPFTDPDGYVAGGVKSDGSFRFEKAVDLPAKSIPLAALGADTGIAASPDTDWAMPFTDPDGFVSAGVRPDGTFEAFKFRNSTRSSMIRVAAVGDSLTAGYSSGAAWDAADAYPAKLGLALGAGVTVFNRGFSGATSDQINVHIAALRLNFTVTGGVIAASGVTNLTKTQTIGRWTDTDTINIYGYLNGIYGLLNNTPGVGWKFTRAVAGTAVPADRVEFEGQYREHAWDTLVYAVGRNDINTATTGMEDSIADHAVRGYVDAAEYLIPRRKQFAFMGTILQTTETPGSNGWNLVHEINDRVKALYPANYIDLLGYLTTDALTDAGLTPTTADTDAMALGMIPPQLMDDTTHYSRAAANAIATNLVAPYLKKKGWV